MTTSVKQGALLFPTPVIDYFAALQDKPVLQRCEEAAIRAGMEFSVLHGVLGHRLIPAVLDIGCGLAIVTAMLANFHRTTDIHLMDGNGTLPRHTGYKGDTQAWADVDVGMAMVRANVGKGKCVHVHWPDPNLSIAVDLIISLRSWGHHYPIQTYLPLAVRCLNPKGLLIVDIRNSTDGAHRLVDAGFKLIAKLPDPSQKCQRLAFEKPA